ncbi:MAG: O-antigen ligase family protein [Planctomycetota bacterium]
MNAQLSFWIFAAACALAACVAAWRLERKTSVGVGLAVSLLAATWFQLTPLETPLHVQSAVAAALMIAFCVHSLRRIWSPITLLDCLMASMVVWNVVADSMASGFDLVLPFRAYGEWALPYVTGRFAVMHRDALGHLAPWFAGAGALIGLAAISESLTGINLWEACFVEIDDLVQTHRAKRFDLAYRALGPTRHPIFLAVVLLTVIPWAIGWRESGPSRRDKILATLALVSISCGMLATLSRGPVLAALFGVAFAAAVFNRIARGVLIATVVLGGLVAYWQSDALLDWLDSTEGRKTVVIVDDEERVYSGSRNRLFVLEIYGPLIPRGGVFGYGTEAVSSFPPNIPGLPTEASSRERLGIVDNSFILVGLRFGLIGLGLLIALFLSAVVGCLSLNRVASTFFFPVGSQFVVALAAVLLALAIEVTTVFWSYDFAFWILFLFGVVSGMQVRAKLVTAGRID